MRGVGHVRRVLLRTAQQARKLALLDTTMRALTSDEVIVACWWTRNTNWGDALNPVLIRHISGREPLSSKDVINVTGIPVYAVVGSILSWNRDPNLVVWGAGFISKGGRFPRRPRAILAVRGPLTRDAVLAQGLGCPAVFGDPALLYPRYYTPNRSVTFDIGIIPHYVDGNHPDVQRLAETANSTIIDITGPTTDVVDQISSCRYIASSSLHGLIAADAFGVPNAWIAFSDKVKGGGFKFHDYFASIRRPCRGPIVVSAGTRAADIWSEHSHYALDIDMDALYAACPFRADQRSCLEVCPSLAHQSIPKDVGAILTS